MSAKWSLIDNVITYFNNSNLYQHEFDDDVDETYHLLTSDKDDVCCVYSQSTADNALLGRIDHTTVNYVLKSKHTEMEFSKYFL